MIDVSLNSEVFNRNRFVCLTCSSHQTSQNQENNT